MAPRFGILVYPGTWSDTDWRHALVSVAGYDAEYVFHKETSLSRYDGIVVPGGFSYGDYLRPGAIARFSPVTQALRDYALGGGPVIGSCNGFQVLCEAGLLPGALLRNSSLEFRCRQQGVRVERAAAPFTSDCAVGEVLSIPVSHGDGNYFADYEALARLEGNGQVVFRYCDEQGNVSPEANPNGSRNGIAGVVNEAGNVLGLMPHPERVVEPLLGGTDGLRIIHSIARHIGAAVG